MDVAGAGVCALPDRELVELIYRGRFTAFKMGLRQWWGMLEQPAGEGLQRQAFTLYMNFYQANAVANPAMQAERLCELINKRAEADALYAT